MKKSKEFKKNISVLISVLLLISIFTTIPFQTKASITHEINVNTSSANEVIVYKSNNEYIDVADFGNNDYVDLDSSEEIYYKVYIDSEIFSGMTVNFKIKSIDSGTINTSSISIGNQMGSYSLVQYVPIDLSIYSGKIELSIWLVSPHGYKYYDGEPVKLNVYSEIASGTCGDKLTWQLCDNGTLEISGMGEMDDYYYLNSAPWYSYRSNITSVKINNGVTSIGTAAFLNCTNLVDATISDSVTNIVSWAFEGCTHLTRVTVDSNNMNYSSFNGDLYNKDQTELLQYAIGKTATSFIVPESVTIIDHGAFHQCTYLSNVTMYNSVTGIGNEAFYDCSNLSDVYYIGAESQWNTISIGSDNISLWNAKIHFIDSAKIPVSNCTISLATTSYIYDGTAKMPSITVEEGTKKLTSGTDYTVSYSNNTDVGTATVTITGKGKYSGAVSKTFTISSRSISSASVMLGTTSYTYDGTAKKPSVTIKDGSTTLVSGIDYTVSYSNNTDVGIATVTIIGKENYSGVVTKTFTISAESISSEKQTTVKPTEKQTTTKETEKQTTVKPTEKETTYEETYTVTFIDDEKVISTQIVKKGGFAIEPKLAKKGYTLFWTKDFDNVWEDIVVETDWFPNDYEVRFNAAGGKVSEKSIDVTYGENYGELPYPERGGYQFEGWYTKKSGGEEITKDTEVDITKTQTLYAHWTKAKVPENTIKKKTQVISAKNKSIKLGTKGNLIGAKTSGDGKLTYKSGNTAVATVSSKGVITPKKSGKAVITITASETTRYKKATRKITITVLPKQSQSITVNSIPKFYKGKSTFNIKVKTKGNVKVKFSSSNKKIAQINNSGVVKLTGCGVVRFTITAPETAAYKKATKVIKLEILPQKVRTVKLTSSGKGNINVSWAKDDRATGYIVVFSKDSKFSENMTRTIKTTNTSISYGNMPSMKYYVKIQAVYGAGIYRGDWSDVNMVVVK